MSQTYTITLKSTGYSFSASANETILDAALRQGVALNSGCRRGICGVCIGALESGEIHYIDDEEPMAFFDENGGEGKVVICEAYPRSDLVLDLTEMQLSSQLEEKNLLVTVVAKEALSPTVTRLLLELPEDEFLQYLPGQEIQLLTGADLEYQWLAPLAAAPIDKHTLEIHLPETSPDAFKQLQTGDELRVIGPQGDFVLHTDRQSPTLLLCDAEGFAAIKALLETSLVRQNPHQHVLLSVADEEQPYQQEITTKLAAKHANLACQSVSGEAIADAISTLGPLLKATHDATKWEVYLCAHADLINEAEFELISLGISSRQLYRKQLYRKQHG